MATYQEHEHLCGSTRNKRRMVFVTALWILAAEPAAAQKPDLKLFMDGIVESTEWYDIDPGPIHARTNCNGTYNWDLFRIYKYLAKPGEKDILVYTNYYVILYLPGSSCDKHSWKYLQIERRRRQAVQAEGSGGKENHDRGISLRETNLTDLEIPTTEEFKQFGESEGPRGEEQDNTTMETRASKSMESPDYHEWKFATPEVITNEDQDVNGSTDKHEILVDEDRTASSALDDIYNADEKGMLSSADYDNRNFGNTEKINSQTHYGSVQESILGERDSEISGAQNEYISPAAYGYGKDRNSRTQYHEATTLASEYMHEATTITHEREHASYQQIPADIEKETHVVEKHYLYGNKMISSTEKNNDSSVPELHEYEDSDTATTKSMDAVDNTPKKVPYGYQPTSTLRDEGKNAPEYNEYIEYVDETTVAIKVKTQTTPEKYIHEGQLAYISRSKELTTAQEYYEYDDETNLTPRYKIDSRVTSEEYKSKGHMASPNQDYRHTTEQEYYDYDVQTSVTTRNKVNTGTTPKGDISINQNTSPLQRKQRTTVLEYYDYDENTFWATTLEMTSLKIKENQLAFPDQDKELAYGGEFYDYDDQTTLATIFEDNAMFTPRIHSDGHTDESDSKAYANKMAAAASTPSWSGAALSTLTNPTAAEGGFPPWDQPEEEEGRKIVFPTTAPTTKDPWQYPTHKMNPLEWQLVLPPAAHGMRPAVCHDLAHPGVMQFGGLNLCDRKLLVQSGKYIRKLMGSPYEVVTRCNRSAVGVLYENVTAHMDVSSGPGWYLVHFPVAQIRQYMLTFRLSYRRSGTRMWRVAHYGQRVTFAKIDPRLKPDFPCPPWVVYSAFCLFVTDHVRIQGDKPYEDYDAQIVTFGLAPRDDQWEASALEYKEKRYAFTFRVYNCDPTWPYNGSSQGTWPHNGTCMFYDSPNASERTTEDDWMSNTTSPLDAALEKLFGKIPYWKKPWFWVGVLSATLPPILFCIAFSKAKRKTFAAEMRNIQVLSPSCLPVDLILLAPPGSVSMSCSRGAMEPLPPGFQLRCPGTPPLPRSGRRRRRRRSPSSSSSSSDLTSFYTRSDPGTAPCRRTRRVTFADHERGYSANF